MTNQPQQDVCCLMGDRVAGNPTQYMLEKAIEAGRLDWRFLTFQIPALDFEGALRGARIFGFRGIMLTPPHDVTVLPYLEEISEVARLSKQVNCIKQVGGQLHGENTLGKALSHLVEQSTDIRGNQVTILGTGPLARVLAAEFALQGAKEVLLIGKDADQQAEAKEFVDTLVEQTPLESCTCHSQPSNESLKLGEECRLLINASSLRQGPSSNEMPIKLATIPRETVVADLVYNPPSSALLREAQELDCTTIDGLTLLIEQTALAFEAWTGVSADRQTMREAVEEFLVL